MMAQATMPCRACGTTGKVIAEDKKCLDCAGKKGRPERVVKVRTRNAYQRNAIGCTYPLVSLFAGGGD
jgi:DnaJ-class molecular chaperone